jgi:sigma-B regulation protein RsbU (phosphoserine phosphatase)
MDLSREVMEADACSLLLLDEETGELVFRVALSEVGDKIKEMRRPVGQGVSGWVAATGQAALIPDAYADERFDPSTDQATGYRTRSILCVPLMVRDRLIGVSQLINKLSGEAFTQEDLELFRLLSAQVAIAVENARLHAHRLRQERLERELAFAKSIQQSFLPQELPRDERVEFAASCTSAHEVGGDFYDVIPLSDSRYAVVIGDVSGKGVPAALYMARLVSEIRHLTVRGEEPGRVLEILNHQLATSSQRGMFVTLVCLVLEPSAGRMAYANAGHLPPIICLPQKGKTLALVSGSGPPLGIKPDTEYSSSDFELEPGAVAVLYTDGILEAQAPDGSFFGMERLERMLLEGGRSAQEVFHRVLQAVEAFAGDQPQHDDITLVTFSIKS